MWKRIGAALLALGLCLPLSGCAVTGFDAQALMSPPKANEDQQSIHKLLQGSKSDITFIYPKTGEYRSAIITHDFTGSGKLDALGFYSAEDGSVQVQFLTKSDGKWKTADTFQNSATQVDRVCFGDLDGDGVDDVLIGWGSTSGSTGRTANVCAYLYGDGNLTEYTLGTYGELTVTDFDGDGKDELFTADKYIPAEEENAEESPALARVFSFEDGQIRELYTAPVDHTISNYISIAFGKLSAGTSGVVLDGAKADGSMTTQIFYVRDGALKNEPSGVNTDKYVNVFSRPSTAVFTSRDLNGDGVIEIPVVSPLPGIAADVALDSTSYFVEWGRYDFGGGSRPAVRTLINSGENYWFELPAPLWGKISASNTPQTRTVTYTEVVGEGTEESPKLLASPLFSIRVFTRSAWDSRGAMSGYEKIIEQSDLVYGIQVFTADEEYLSAIQQIKSHFRLISDQ